MRLSRPSKVNKNDLEMKEMNDKHTFDMAQGGRLNQLKAFKDKIAKNEEIIAKKEEDKNKFEGMNEKAENGKAADQACCKIAAVIGPVPHSVASRMF